jgi:3',5'-cyclic AMP phosphodiesterase CpdA
MISIIITSSFNSIASKQKTLDFNSHEFINQNNHEINKNNDNPDFKILYPLSSFPVIVKKGGNFTIDFQSRDFENFYAYIRTAYEPIVDKIKLEIGKISKTGKTWHATVFVPLNTPEELYNLTVYTENNDELNFYNSIRAVKVLNKFPENFSFIHIADLHIGDLRGFRENIKETIGWKSVKKCIEEVNLINPDFVIISGDLVFGQLYPFEYSREYKICYDMIQSFDVPTFLCPGNHDGYFKFGEDGFDFWKEYFGPLNYSFNFGNYHFIAINSYDWSPIKRRAILFVPLTWGGYISDDQLNWIEEDLNKKNANMTFMFLHHNPLWDTKSESLLRFEYYNRNELCLLIEKYKVNMVLAGHVHYDNVTILNDTIYLTTTTPESSISAEDGYWGYRLIEIKNNQISNYNYKEPKYSIPSYKLNHEFIDQYTATIENDLEIDIKAHLKFLLPLGEYVIENGKILMNRKNDEKMEIYIVSDVKKESDVTITLSPVFD